MKVRALAVTARPAGKTAQRFDLRQLANPSERPALCHRQPREGQMTLVAKMRWKVGSIVPRSRSICLCRRHSTKIGTSLPLPEFISLSPLVLEPVAVGGLFGAIAADCHAAPFSCPAPGMVGEHQRAAMSLACFHAGEIFFTHELRQCFANRQQ